jgi:ubiquinone/menaquinone biosynthesis C-methylase UbiE
LLRINKDPFPLLLDCGAGNGRFSFYLAQVKPDMEIVCLDINERMIGKIRELRKFEGLNDQIEIVQADMQHLPFRGKCFSGILNIGNLWYVPDYTKACSEMLRVCRGALVLDHVNLINPRNFVLWAGHLLKLLLLSIFNRQTYPLYYRTPKQILSPFVNLSNRDLLCISEKSYAKYYGPKLLCTRFLLYVSFRS